MRKPVNPKEEFWQQLTSVGAMLMSFVAFIIVLYVITFAVRFFASFMV